MKRWIPHRGYVDTVFEKGHEITDEEIRRSRGYRREALSNAQKMQKQGFERLEDMVPVDYSMLRAALMIWPQDSYVLAETVYEPRGYYGKPTLKDEYWIKSPIPGIDPAAIVTVAALNYESRPQYRRSWEAKLALEMTPEEIEVELMLMNYGEEQ